MLRPHLIDHVKPYMTKPITNAEESVRFMCHLYLDNHMFHFETHPEDCVTTIYKEPGRRAVTQQAFTKAQILHLNRRRLELFDHLEDPFELPLCLLQQANQLPKDKKPPMLNNRAKSILQDMLTSFQDKWGGYDALDSEDQEAISELYKLTK